MGRNKLLVGGIVLVALIVIAYFAFMYPPPSKEDTSGAIGVAKKYRGEQISDKDVVLQQQEAAAAEFNKATPEEQAGMLERAPNVLASAVTRASEDLQAKLFRAADAGSREQMLAHLTPAVQEAVVKAVGLTADQWNKLTPVKKSEAMLEKAPVGVLAQVVKFAEAKTQCSAFGRADVELQRSLIESLPAEAKSAVMLGRGPEAMNERSQGMMERTNQQTE